MVGLFGFGYAIGGLTLVFKQISSVSGLVTNMLLFLNGTLLPVHHFPAWLETIAVFLPTTQGIIVLRKVVIDGASLTAVWQDGSMVFLAVQIDIVLDSRLDPLQHRRAGREATRDVGAVLRKATTGRRSGGRAAMPNCRGARGVTSVQG